MNQRHLQRLVKRAIAVRARHVSPQGPLALNRPLSEATVRQYERRFRIQLPAEYRWFIRTQGDGGLGPYSGVLRLREALGAATRTEGARVHRRFPHLESWNLRQAEAIANLTPAMSARARERVLRRWTVRHRDAYSAPALLDGAMPVCDLGCGYLMWLVVTGSNAGHVRLVVRLVARAGRGADVMVDDVPAHASLRVVTGPALALRDWGERCTKWLTSFAAHSRAPSSRSR